MEFQNYMLENKDDLTSLVSKTGVNDWHSLLKYIEALPYGRNTNREDLGLVIKEKRGTCSSKHALLKHLAELNEIENVKLYIGIYKMNAENTLHIGNTLKENRQNYVLDFLPEAHCYLEIENKKYDFTTPSSKFEKLENFILEEIEIKPFQVNKFKIEFHQGYLKNWIKGYNKSVSESGQLFFDDIWQLREQCISKIS